MLLKSYLRQIEMTHAEFGLIMGIDEQYVSQLVCGVHKPGPRLAKDIVNISGGQVTVEDLNRPYETRRVNKELEHQLLLAS